MYKAILTMLLAVVSSSAAAEWVEIGNNEAATVYADPATLRRGGNMVKLWELYVAKTTQSIVNKPYLSVKLLREYDCKGKQARTLSASFHPQGMGRGEIVYGSSGPTRWEPVKELEIASAIQWKWACGQ